MVELAKAAYLRMAEEYSNEKKFEAELKYCEAKEKANTAAARAAASTPNTSTAEDAQFSSNPSAVNIIDKYETLKDIVSVDQVEDQKEACSVEKVQRIKRDPKKDVFKSKVKIYLSLMMKKS